MSKNAGKNGERLYKEREVKVILERLEGQFQIFLEILADIHDRLGKIETILDRSR